MLIKNAVLETVEHGRIPHGFLQIESGKIVAMGNMEDCPKLDGLDYSCLLYTSSPVGEGK